MGSQSIPRDVVAITGASGYIGAAVVARLAERYQVVALDSHPPSHSAENVEHVDLDITSDSSVTAAVAKLRARNAGRIASFIHLAGYFDLTGEPNQKYYEVNVAGTERLLRALQTLQLEQFLFVSSLLVHAPGRHGEPINEDWPLASPFPYPLSKIETEALLCREHGDVPLVLLRPAGVYDDLCHSAFLSHQIARIYERQLISHVYPADLDTGQPFIHLDDLIDVLTRVVERRRDLPAELPLLVGEDQTPSFGQIQDELGRLIHGESWSTMEVPAVVAKTGVWVENEVLDEAPFIKPWMVEMSDDHYEINITRAKTLLDWQPKHTLLDTLPKMIAALKRDPSGWYRANKLNAAKVAAADISAKSKDDKSKEPGQAEKAMRTHMDEMRRMHFDMLWVHYVNLLLGAWLVVSPFLFGAFGRHEFSATIWQVTHERGLWDPVLRSSLLGWSDLIAGFLIMGFSALSMSPRLSWAQWANSAVGTWILFAPLFFWAPEAAVYNNDTLIGALVITFSILVPMMPGMAMSGMMDQSDLPPGWSYNPSTYLQRLPIIALGAVGFFISRHLAAYQLGHIDTAWEPFFTGATGRNGTETIITSNVSKAWPVADAGLGAVVYLFEVLMGAMGDRRRWRTMPWMVAVFGFTVVPLGGVSIYFIIIQPIVIGTWCSLCLLAGLAMLVMIPFSLDELIATGQFLVQSRKRGEPFWQTFFRGAAQPGGGCDQSPGFDAPLAESLRCALRGVATVPWTLAVSAAIGIGLMFTRLVFDTDPPLAGSDHFVGALVVTFATIAIADVARPLRFVNALFGAWLIVAPWQLIGASTPMATGADVIAGLVLIALSLPRGPRSAEHYGSWDRFVI